MPGTLQLVGLQRRLGEAIAWHALAADPARPALTVAEDAEVKERVAAAVGLRAELLRTAGIHPRPPVTRPEGRFILASSPQSVAADFWLAYVAKEEAILCWLPPPASEAVTFDASIRLADAWAERLVPRPAGPLPVEPAVRGLEYEPPPTLVSKVERLARRAVLFRRIMWFAIVVLGLAFAGWCVLGFAFNPYLGR